jgi:hypothetical protein
MTHLACLAAAAALAMAAAPVIVEEITRIQWSQLPDPSAQEFEDPYRDLTPKLMSDLISLARLRERAGGEGLTTEESRKTVAQTAELEATLQEAGVDVEWLLSQRWVVAERRQQAAVAANPTLDGQSAEIAGFLIPAPPTESGEASAYLLPDRGICHHLPPPPPNQLVRLVMKDVPKTGGACFPVVARGTLRARETRYEVTVIEHTLPMWSAWTLETEAVRTVGVVTP